MKKDRWMISLYLFHAIYFISLGMTTFVSKFYGEIGLTDGKIGLISAMMAFVALFLQPIWGTLADRARYKRNVSAAALAVAGGLCFLVMPATSNFIWLILVLTLYNAFLLPVMPVGPDTVLTTSASPILRVWCTASTASPRESANPLSAPTSP